MPTKAEISPTQEQDTSEAGSILGKLARLFSGPTAEETKHELQRVVSGIQNIGNGVYSIDNLSGFKLEYVLSGFLKANPNLRITAITPSLFVGGAQYTSPYPIGFTLITEAK